jgi:taurine dioxygenase
MEGMMALELCNMSGTLGVEVTGIDLAEGVSSKEASLLQAALRDRLLMVIKNQNLSPKQYVEGIKVFGDPMHQHLAKLLMDEHPEIAVLDSRVANSKSEDGKIMPIGSKDWHTDHTNHAKPPKMTVLYAVKLPKEGGDTGFANMHGYPYIAKDSV